MVEDARQRTKVWLDAKITDANLVDDGGDEVAWVALFADFKYPIEDEFFADTDPVDLLFLIGTPTSEALPAGIGFIENVPITIQCISKTNITGTKLRWTAEEELRLVAKTYPHGSVRVLGPISDSEKDLGSTTLYSVTYVLRYMRFV